MERGEGIAIMADVYIDPLEAAKKRQVPKNTGVSYFPGVNAQPLDYFRTGEAKNLVYPGVALYGSQPVPQLPQLPTLNFRPLDYYQTGRAKNLVYPGTPIYKPDVEELVKRYAY